MIPPTPTPSTTPINAMKENILAFFTHVPPRSRTMKGILVGAQQINLSSPYKTNYIGNIHPKAII